MRVSSQRTIQLVAAAGIFLATGGEIHHWSGSYAQANAFAQPPETSGPSRLEGEADGDFEAALSQQPARPVATGTAQRTPLPASQGILAPAGTIPTPWRGVTQIFDDDTWSRATRDAREGRVDPYTLVDQVVGGVPLPPGAYPTRCEYTPLRLTYTSGTSVSPEYDALKRKALAKEGDAPYRFRRLHVALAVEATKERMAAYEKFYTGQGFTSRPGRVMRQFEQRIYHRPSTGPGKPGMRIIITVDSGFESLFCPDKGVSLPSGPYITLILEP